MDLPSPTPVSPSASLDLTLNPVSASDLPPLAPPSPSPSSNSAMTSSSRPRTAPAHLPKHKSSSFHAGTAGAVVTTDSAVAVDVSRPPPSPIITPAMRTRMRTASGASMTFLQPGPIMLVDHTVEPSEQSAGLFARNVIVGDYTVVSGGSRMRSAGAYVCWNVTVETLEGHKILIRKRYSEFVALREKLVASFPHSMAALPSLPPKSLVSKFRPKFLENRRKGLNYFLSCILMNPEFCGSPLIKQFLFDYD